MLDTLRRGAGNWLSKGLLFLLVIAFAVWGVADVFRGYGQGSLAQVGKTEISADQFQQAYQNELNQLSAQVGRRITPEQARMFQLDQRVLQRLIGTAALDTQTKQLGMGMSTQTIAESIRTDPNFAGVDGKFSKQAFDGVLRQNGLSEAGYLAMRQREDVREQLTDSILSSVSVPQTYVEALHKYREESRVVQFFKIEPEKLVKVAEPEESKLREYYEANKRQFMTPAYRKIVLLMMPRDAVKPLVTVTDDEIKAAFEDGKDKFNTPEKRRVLQLAFKDKAAADAAYATLSKAPNFIEAAGKLGYKDSDIDLGVVTKRDLIDSKIAEAAFGLKKDEVSRPVEGQFTTVILRATDITPGTNKTFDDVKAQVKDQLVDERAGKELQAMHDKVEDERAAGKTLKDAAAKLNLTFKEIEAVDRAGLGADGKPVLDHPDTARIMNGVFAAALGVEAEAVELSDRGFAWFDVLGTTPEKEKPFDTIKADVKTTWMEIEKAKALGEAAAGLVSRLIKGEPIETLAKEAGGVVEKTPAIKRTTSPPGLTADAVRQAFALPIGAASSSPTADNKSRTVFRVAEVTPAAAPTKEEADKLRGEMLRGMQADALNAYVAGLQKRYGVTVNNAVLSQTLGLDRQTR